MVKKGAVTWEGILWGITILLVGIPLVIAWAYTEASGNESVRVIKWAIGLFAIFLEILQYLFGRYL